MEVTVGAEDAFVREWTPSTHILNLIPPRIQNGLFSSELCLTCVDAVSEFVALGTNAGLVYWYDRKKGNIQRLRCEATTSPITYVKIVSTVDFMVGAGNAAGQVTVFQIPKEHPEDVPDNLKPKVEPKVERYTIGDLHKSKITAIEWSKNGMRLFSGDKNGLIVMTEIDFYMHLCKSMEIVNEDYEIVQISYYMNSVLVSSVYRSIVCERVDGRWLVTQLGNKDRKSLCPLGGVFRHSYWATGGAGAGGGVGGAGGAAAAYCARAGYRVWRADVKGNVQHTLLFKDAVSNPLTEAELLNPSPLSPVSPCSPELQFGPLHVFRDHFLVTYNQQLLYILDPQALTAVAVVQHLRKILSVSVNKEEIFVLEGPRSLVRLAHAPEPVSKRPEDPLDMMTKSLTTSIQQAVNTVRDITLDQTVPFITSVLEQPISLLNNAELIETGTVISGEECFELPPIKHLPNLPNNVLESIINEFKDVSSETEELRRVKSEELERKLKLYNSIMEKKCDEEIIHSRRGRRRDGGSGQSTPRGGSTPRGANTPRGVTPVRKAPDNVSYTMPCVMNLSVYDQMPQQSDELLEKQIEEKERILAKRLNLESLSIRAITVQPDNPRTLPETPPTHQPEVKVNKAPAEPVPKETPKVTTKPINTVKLSKESDIKDLVPKVVKLPNNWNLESIELRLEMHSNGIKDGRHLLSPDENLDGDWEII